MISITISELAALMEAEFAGDGNITVSGVVHPQEANSADMLAIAMAPEFEEMLVEAKFKSAVLAKGADWQALGLKAAIFAARPRYAIAELTQHFADDNLLEPGIHETAIINKSANIGANVSIGAFVTVEAGTSIGEGSRIMSHSSIGANAKVGNNALIHNGVRVGRNVTIGKHAIIHQNAVIAADGFSFVTPQPDAVEAAKASSNSKAQKMTSVYARIHSLAAVTVGDNVEIGANSTIDRGTLRDTYIGSGTKIDNQVQVGHNVKIGANCLVCAQVGLAGSSEIGNYVVLGGKSGVADHVKIGDNVLVAAASAVASNVPSGNIVMGVPAQKREEVMRSLMAVRRLPRLFDTVENLRKKLGNKKD